MYNTSCDFTGFFYPYFPGMLFGLRDSKHLNAEYDRTIIPFLIAADDDVHLTVYL